MDASAGIVSAAIEQAVARLEPGGRLVERRELTGGVSANVFGLDIITAAGTERRVVFRQHRPAGFKGHLHRVTALEHGLLAALHERGFAVPQPYLLGDGGDVTAPYLVTEWVDGSTDVAPGDLPGALEQMAQFLVALHGLDPATVALPEIEPIEEPAAAIIPYLPATDSGRRVRAALAARPRPRHANPAALLHGDYWPGNVMWRHGRLVAVIDWEDACVGDPLADLATARVELLCRYGAEAMEQFTRLYLASRARHPTPAPLKLDPLPLWEVYVSASALATMHAWGLEPGEEAHRRQLTGRFFDVAAGRL